MDFQKYDEIFNKKNYPLFIQKNGIYLPKDDGKCICLSGKKYKDCCKQEVVIALNKENQQCDITELKEIYYKAKKKLLSYRVVNKAINKKNISYCSAEKVFGNCSDDKNVKSHTMSRGNVLTNLAGIKNGSVIAFNDHKVFEADKIKNEINLYYEYICLNNASLTVSFCKKHDKELFFNIETDGHNEYKNSPIQNLEYALKAVTFDIYYKIENIQYMSLLIKETKKVLSSYKGEKSLLLQDYHITVKELFKLFPMMLMILQEIKDLKQNGIMPKLKTTCFNLPMQKVNISCSEVIPEDKQYYFINVINSSKPYMIFSYYNDNKNSSWIVNEKRKFDTSMDKIGYLYNFFLSFLVGNAQNIYINKNAFNKLNDMEKLLLYLIHREGTANIPDYIYNSYQNDICKFLFKV
ncbi:SEC-C domain-containing protein [Clostridium botulinum]|nr:SEC-C domain-containing protein [Clostridium botulinum]